jgi:esterase/lipase
MIKKSILAITLGTTLVFSSGIVGAAPNKQSNNSEQGLKPYYVDESKLPFNALAGYDTLRYWGVHNGAGYRMEVPKDWNGKLVLYAHGYRGTGLELTVTNPSIRKHYIKNGYAWAASSYSTNGYDVAEGVKDTHALVSLFNGLVSKPKIIYITGHSMGGHITAILAEQYESAYDGALTMCGVTGDTELFDYFTDFGLVAQALTGIEKDDQSFPADANYVKHTIPAMKRELGINEQLTEEGHKLKAITMNLTGGERPLFDAAWKSYKNFLFDQMPLKSSYIVAPQNVVNNTDSVYQFDGDMSTLSAEEKALNKSVFRVTTLPSSNQKGLTGIPGVKGTHEIPMVSMHTIGDLFVPFHMQQIHAKRTKEQGNSDLLVTRAIRDIGHCDFTKAEQKQAFDDLVRWVEEGIKPEGDDVLNPSVVADPLFGKKFTMSVRPFDPIKDWPFTVIDDEGSD